MACKEWLSQLDCYLDGKLDAANAAGLVAHLRSCPSCTTEVLSRVRMKRSVQTAGKRYVASAAFRNKVLESIEKEQHPAKAPRRWGFVLVPAFALLLAAFFLSTHLSRERATSAHVYSELADLHVATLASPTPVDVLSSDRHTVKPWFQGKIPFTFNLPELAGSEFSLLGGRVFYLQQTPGAHLIYQLRKHEISVFMLPDQAGEMGAISPAATSTLSFHTQSWTQNGLRYFVVGDVNPEDINSLANQLKNAK